MNLKQKGRIQQICALKDAFGEHGYAPDRGQSPCQAAELGQGC